MLISGRVHSGLFGIYSFGYYITIETFLGNLNFFFCGRKTKLVVMCLLNYTRVIMVVITRMSTPHMTQ